MRGRLWVGGHVLQRHNNHASVNGGLKPYVSAQRGSNEHESSSGPEKEQRLRCGGTARLKLHDERPEREEVDLACGECPGGSKANYTQW